MRRDAQIEAFRLERQREQNQLNTSLPPVSPRSAHSASPRRTPVSRPPPSPIAPLSPRNPLPPLSAKFLTPKQRIQHLANLRRGIVKYTDEERARSASPAVSHTSAVSSERPPVSGYSPYTIGHFGLRL